MIHGALAGRSARALVLAVAAALLLPLLSAVPAAADTSPPAGIPATVSADVLPTVQIDGVAWAQLVVGDTVYVTGKFTSARPAGAPAGTGEVPRSNILAYDLRTGELRTGFTASLNSQGAGLAASPDGKRIYVAGNFTAVNGVNRYRIAALDATTGAVVTSFAPGVNARTKTVLVKGDTVYVGGIFTEANGNARTRLAAFRASDGALLPWAPSADGEVFSLVSPDGSRVVAGGRFTTINGGAAYGMGAVDPVTGASLPWAATQVVRNAGAESAIYSLSTDGRQVYGTGYTFGKGGNLEGSFAADATTGAVTWVTGCRGDVYSVQPIGDAVYTVGHAHDCAAIGGHPQTEPWTFQRAMATSADARRTNAGGTFGGRPAPELLTWWPTLDIGSFTGQDQAAWTVAGNSEYVVVGGEFPRVNNVAQQGLARFAVRSTAPNAMGPRYQADFAPELSSTPTGVRVRWQTTWDYESRELEYRIVRDGRTLEPIGTVRASSTWWDRPAAGFVDTDVEPGSTHTYRIYAYDADGNSTNSTTATTTVSAVPASAYAAQVLADGASSYWRLGEPSGSTAQDGAGLDDLRLDASAVRGAQGAIGGDADAATTFAGSATVPATTTTAQKGPDTFSAEAWVRTTSTRGGKVIGFGNSATGSSSSYDRHVYLTNDGRFTFGVHPGAVRTVASGSGYNDGKWHHVVATLSSDGMALYVDGARAARDTSVTAGETVTGYWRIGGDSLSGWPNQPASTALAGTVDDVAVYPSALGLPAVQAHYRASGRTLSGPIAPADAYGAAVWAAGADAQWRLEEASGTAVAGSSPTGEAAITAGAPVRGVPGLAGSRAVQLDGRDDVVVAKEAKASPSRYSVELWFQTTTTRGGMLASFSRNQTARSSTSSREVWMLDDGRIAFGPRAVTQSIVVTPAKLNDGKWHHLVATQGPAGTALHVDGQVVGTTTDATAASHTGYWRIGGETTWSATSSPYFAGTVDEIATYSTVLDDATVAEHFVKGGGELPNREPVAAFTASARDLVVGLDASGSTDADGLLASWAWDFGDGATGTGVRTEHAYAAAGTYTVVLTVTDDDGAKAVQRREVTVTAPPNREPVAAFTASVRDLVVGLDASGSTDADGSVASWAWDFGDGSTGAGAKVEHTYTTAGTRTVVLTVTDDDGAKAVQRREVTVTDAAPVPVPQPGPAAVVAADSFARTVSGGLGSAETGGAWTVAGGASNFSVAGGAARIVAPKAGATSTATLAGVSSTDTDLRFTVELDKATTGGGVYVTVPVRRVDASNDYRARVKFLASGALNLSVSRNVGGVETALKALTVPGTSYAAGQQLQVRVRAAGAGSTDLAAKVWPAGTPEPADWQVTATDTTAALQVPGGIGVVVYLSGSSTGAPLTAALRQLTATTSVAG